MSCYEDCAEASVQSWHGMAWSMRARATGPSGVVVDKSPFAPNHQPAMYVTVKLGDRLPTVALAQARLLEKGESELTVDGVFDSKTQAAVSRLQKRAGLALTGEVDQPTWNVELSLSGYAV